MSLHSTDNGHRAALLRDNAGKYEKEVNRMDYPVIDPVGTGTNIKLLIKNSGNTIAGVGRMLGIADMSTMYKWLRGDALPGIDNMLALSILLDVAINDILVTK